jgi:hypothetical protein
MTQRETLSVEETQPYAPITPSASPVAVAIAQDVAIDQITSDATEIESN